MVRNSTSKSSSSRPPCTKNFTSKPPSNNTSSTGAGQSERHQQQPTRGKPGACWSCGVTWHKRADCMYQLNGYKWKECGEVGHKATVCPRCGKSSRRSGPAQQSHEKDRRVHASAADNDSYSVTRHTVHVPAERASLHNSCCVQVNTVQSKQFDVTATVNGVPVSMALDICAEGIIASSSLWHRLGKPALKPPPKLRAYGGGEVPAIGQCDVEVHYESQRQRLPLVFVESPKERALFGSVDQRV